VSFPNLEVLYLSENEITNIKVFEKVKFQNLKELYLSDNQINENDYSSLINNLKGKYNLYI